MKKLSVLYTNARSIVNKINKLRLEIDNGQFDIVILTETHLDDSVLDSEIFPSDFVVFRRDRKHHDRLGGGILIAVRNTFKLHQRDDIFCESELFVNILLDRNKKITLGVFYRPPSRDLQPLEELQSILSEISTSQLILLDFILSEVD